MAQTVKDAKGISFARGTVLVCIDPGKELGLDTVTKYQASRLLDPWTVTVRAPDGGELSPRMAARFVVVVDDERS